MAEENYPQAPTIPLNPTQRTEQSQDTILIKETFPDAEGRARLLSYEYYEKLFFGNHFDAFAQKVSDEKFNAEYAKLRYVVANFAGLITKAIADLLFIEPPKIKVADGDQEFVDELIQENHLRTLQYETALSNSYNGDAVIKLRIGKRNPGDDKTTIIIEEVTPKIYFPKLNPFNIKEQPSEITLAWTFTKNNKKYLRKEIHTIGKIVNEVWEMEQEEVKAKIVVPSTVIPGLKEQEDTKIDRLLVIHIPNWRAGNRHFGISDYYDLSSLFYAINNRLTMVDNILDKHSDPILALPQGILDEEGKIKKAKLGLFERPQDATKENDPAYVTWDANLDSALTEIDKLIEILSMNAEIAPAMFGLDKGGAVESGRALKYKLIRTLAKAQRKQLYYTEGLREVIYVAQLLAKAFGVEINGKKCTKKAVKPEIVWSDGLPADMTEAVDIETKRIDAGLTTPIDAIMRLDDVDEDTAKKKADEIAKSGQEEMLQTMKMKMDVAGNTNKPDQNVSGGE